MTLSALGLAVALGGAACWAGLDATRKALVRDVPPALAAMWLSVGQVPFFAVALAFDAQLQPGYWPPGLSALGLQVVANLLFMKAIHISALSATIPFLSFTPVFAAFVAIPLLGELPSRWQWAGIALVVVGAVSLHARGDAPLWRRLDAGSAMMVGVSACWALSTTLDKLALEHASKPAHALVQTGGVAVALLAWLLLRRAPLSVPRRAWPALGGSVAFAAGALELQLWAIQLLFVGIVETIKRAVGMTSSVVVGRIAFEETIHPSKLVAVALMIAGTVAVVLG